MKAYTVQEFETCFPDEDACLKFVFEKRYGGICPKCGVVDGKFYRMKKRKAYVCKDCSKQIYPLSGTIFNKTSTPLKTWFRAMFNEGIAKNNVGAKEMQRAYGVCYETALRMSHLIMTVMGSYFDPDDPIDGIAEVDEDYFGGKTNKKRGRKGVKTAILGIKQRDGMVRFKVLPYEPDATVAMQFLRDNLAPTVMLMTDGSRLYYNAKKYFKHETVNHSKKEYARPGGIHTNTIECMWSQVNRAMLGTHQHVEPRYLELYVNAFGFRHNFRELATSKVLLEMAATTSYA